MLPRKPAFYYMRYARKKYVYQRRIETAVTECGTYGKRDDPDPFFHEGHRRSGGRCGYRAGCLLLPTHTWANVNAQHPVYDYRNTQSCVGLLTNLFRQREGVVRSLHPTHSLAGYGKNAAEYLAGEEERNTPCTPGGAYDRLKDCGGKILLVGVGHERNTYIHSVEEVLNVPNRLAAEPMLLTTILPDGREKKVYMRKHYNPDQPHISEDFVKLNQAFLDCGAVEVVMFGDAKCLLCDAQKVFRVVRHVLAPDPECLVTKPEISAERWRGFRA